RTATPVSLSAWSLVERLGYDLFDLGVADRAWCAHARLVEQPLRAQPEKPRAPLRRRGLAHAKRARHLSVAPSHHTRRIALDLAQGEIRRMDITLDREATPVTKAPWFWVGV